MRKIFLIGIAGGSASGKSTFSENLRKSLTDMKVVILHMDSYFKAEKERPVDIAPITRKEYMDDNHPLTVDLSKLKQDMECIIKEGTCQVLIVEGLLTLWDEEIYEQLDLKLFVDCQPDERIVRRLKRNMKWGRSFDEIADVYLDMVRYRHDEYVEPTKWRADLILNGSNPSPKVLEMIVAYIQSFGKEG